MQTSRQENEKLLKDLKQAKEDLAESQKKVADIKKFTRVAYGEKVFSHLLLLV
jgi:hypothetical protein